jgi:hypothetical protein
MYEGRGVTSIRFARTRLTISRFPQGPRSAQCGSPNQVRTLIARLTDRKRAKQAHLVRCGAAGADGIVPPLVIGFDGSVLAGPGHPFVAWRSLMLRKGRELLPAPRADPGVRLSRTGLLPEAQRGRRAGPSPTRRSVGESHACRTSSGAGSGVRRDPLPLPSGVLPSTPSAAGHPRLVRALRRYYYPVRLLTPSSTASPPRLPVAALNRSQRLWAE